MAEPTSILGRRNVPLVACASIAGVAAFGALSALLQPGQPSGEASRVAGLCVAISVIACGLVLWIDHPLAVRFRGRLRSSLVAIVLLTAAVTGFALSERGLSTVSFTGVILIATYAGLVVPGRWSRPLLATLLAIEASIQLITPAPRTLDAVAILTVTIAGWLVGVLGNRAHGRAAHVALVLSRTDALTVTLSRRGFFEEFEAGLADADASGEPYSLLVFDLDDFKAVNDQHGLHEGDALLAWVGSTLASVVPPEASAGRLGGDEFAIALPGTDQPAADVIAVRVASAVAERTGISIGCATYDPAQATGHDADDLVRIADAELSAVKRGLDVHHPVLDTTSRRTAATTRDGRRSALPPPIVRYADLVATGGIPVEPSAGVQFGWLVRASCLVAGIFGGVIGAVQLAQGGDTIYDQVLQFTLVPWVFALVGLGLLASSDRQDAPGTPRSLLVYWLPNALLGTGVGGVLLAGHGIDGAVVSGLYVKVMFDAFVLPRGRAFGTLLVMVAWWAGIAALGPADALWAAPVQLSIFLASFAVATTANHAYAEATRQTLAFGRTDPLTGLLNRTGLEAAMRDAPRRAQEADRLLAILLFDLDDLGAVNDTHGHAAGDALLTAVAGATILALPTAYAIGRIGGDEFLVAVPVTSAAAARALEDVVSAALHPIIGISIGSAVMPADGHDIATLMGVADRRSYERKAAASAESPSA